MRVDAGFVVVGDREGPVRGRRLRGSRRGHEGREECPGGHRQVSFSQAKPS